MTKVYFVRHAKPDYSNHDDFARPLTAQGMEDRKLVTRFLEDKQIDVVLSSPFLRAVDTVKEFADSKGLSVRTIPEFQERKVSDEWIEDFMSNAKKQWENFNYKLTGGESLREVQDRNINALQKVLMEYPNQNVVVGSHGTALSTIINYYDSSFGFKDFEKIVGLTPWIVCFTFDGMTCIDIKSINLFEDNAYETFNISL